ncbi:hypothetical protein FOMPIDRAFT_1127952, partial [Fomitopsis schrenkii]
RERHEDTGYISVANALVMRQLVSNLGQRPADAYLKWVKGHRGHKLNEGAVAEAVGLVPRR